MFTELTINNFKNFKHLEVKDIKLVNTISGFNQLNYPEIFDLEHTNFEPLKNFLNSHLST